MSTAAHEPRRVGPHRAHIGSGSHSPLGSKVTPRRNASETSDLNGTQYDSDELPVLIRLPNLRELGSVGTRAESPSRKKRHRIDPPSAASHEPSTRESSKTSKKSFHQRAGDNKLVIGGVVGGLLIVVMLFVFNGSGPTPPADEDGWANQESELLVELPEPAAAESSPAPLEPPGFTFGSPGEEIPQFERKDSFNVPPSTMPAPLLQSDTVALPNNTSPAVAWPADDLLGAQSPPQSKPVNLWPGESISQEPSGYKYSPTDSPSQGDYQSGMYPSDAGTYRLGKLDSNDHLTSQGDQSNILNGNIAIPDTKSVR